MVGIAIALFGWFMTSISDALGYQDLSSFAASSIGGIWIGWIFVSVGILFAIIGVVAPRR